MEMSDIQETNDIKQPEAYWYKYKMQEYEYVPDIPILLSDYIPQIPAAQSLYRLYILHMGCAPLEAAAKVLEACIPRENLERCQKQK